MSDYMKKCLFLLLMIYCLNIQSQEDRRVYCELLGTQKLLSLKVIVTIDFCKQSFLNAKTVVDRP